VSGAGLLHIKASHTGQDGSSLTWKWLKGPAVAKADFGVPTAEDGTNYALCFYDGDRALVAAAQIPAGGVCGGERACWRKRSSGFLYAGRGTNPDGIESLILRAGTDGALTARGGGTGLNRPVLPVQRLPLTVELKNGNGDCWSASYAATRANTASAFTAKGE
jgi:hypothetical protein